MTNLLIFVLERQEEKKNRREVEKENKRERKQIGMFADACSLVWVLRPYLQLSYRKYLHKVSAVGSEIGEEGQQIGAAFALGGDFW